MRLQDSDPLLTPASASKWSHDLKTEHSIANAYIQVITNARHFVYIENQVSCAILYP